MGNMSGILMMQKENNMVDYFTMILVSFGLVGMICILVDMIINKGDFYDDRFDSE
jgi:hypothetical protein